jgi:hypothetical protein
VKATGGHEDGIWWRKTRDRDILARIHKVRTKRSQAQEGAASQRERLALKTRLDELKPSGVREYLLKRPIATRPIASLVGATFNV